MCKRPSAHLAGEVIRKRAADRACRSYLQVPIHTQITVLLLACDGDSYGMHSGHPTVPLLWQPLHVVGGVIVIIDCRS